MQETSANQAAKQSDQAAGKEPKKADTIELPLLGAKEN